MREEGAGSVRCIHNAGSIRSGARTSSWLLEINLVTHAIFGKRCLQSCNPQVTLMTIDIQQRGVDLLATRAAELLDFIAKTAPGFLVEQAKNGQLILNKGLPDYIDANYSRCETIRTLLKRDSPTQLDRVYQEHTFSSDGRSFSEEELYTSIGSTLERTVVSGGAGSGKSVFLKRLFIKSIEHGHTYYPVFFEFRSMRSDVKVSLLDYIYESIAQFSPSFTRKQFNYGLRSGIFYLMLDALDEAPADIRGALIDEIDGISKKFMKCPLVITSRPSQDFQSWEGFRIAHMEPFDLTQCRSFIQRVDYPAEKREEFLEFITEENFAKHRAFLSNPLLASMMLLTFEEFGDIPERKHVFYDKCFQVLLREHDASKGRFRRIYNSGLSHEELENVFTYFCVFSYLDGKYNLHLPEVETYVLNAVEACGISAEVHAIIEDFVDAVSILQKDGSVYEFTHRSFQEYFYARFAVRDRDLELVAKIDEIRETRSSDGAIRMIADMDKTYFERDFLLPVARRVLKDTEGADHVTAPDRLMSKFWARIGIRHHNYTEDGGRSADDKIIVYYSTTHDEEEYPRRKLNLLLLSAISDYNLEVQTFERAQELTNDEILRVFGISEVAPESRGKRSLAEFKISHHNRHKLVALRCGGYAVELSTLIGALVARLEKDISSKTSKLSKMIRSLKA